MLSAPRSSRFIRIRRLISRSDSPSVEIVASASNSAEVISQANRIFSISRADLTKRSPSINCAQSTNSSDTLSPRIRASRAGIRSTLSWPSGRPSRPKRFGRAFTDAASSEMPSSSGVGDGHVLISSIQVAAMPASPIVGITAIGFPSAGTIRNQGRVGLSKNCV